MQGRGSVTSEQKHTRLSHPAKPITPAPAKWVDHSWEHPR